VEWTLSLRRDDEEERVLGQLAAVGIEEDSLDAFASMGSGRYPAEAIPVLLGQLDEPYSEMTLEMVARAIHRTAARPYWADLVARYRRGAPPPGGMRNRGLLQGLAILIHQIATQADLEELIELAGDRSRGASRGWFFGLISRWGGKRGVDVVRAQLDDPLVKVQAAMVLKRADGKHPAALNRLAKALAGRPDPALPTDADEWSSSFDSEDWLRFFKHLARRSGGELTTEVGKAVLAVISTAPLDDEGSVRLVTDLGVVQIGWFMDDTDTVDLTLWGSHEVRDLCESWFG